MLRVWSSFYALTKIPELPVSSLPQIEDFQMQDSFEIITSEGSYPVLVGNGIIKKIPDQYPEAIYLIDRNLLKYIPVPIIYVAVDAMEENKTLERMTDVVIQLRQLGANRESHLVAIGGGIVQDIATFCASIYMRGLAWTYLPSTMLSMADSCVGGKSSINVGSYKNLVGNIYPPKAVVVDIDLIGTLPVDHVLGGLFEASKICYAHSESAMQVFLETDPSPAMSSHGFEEVIRHALTCKKWFIEIDEFDQKERLLLNFGHTFGHALEAGTNYVIPHGIAVGIGMLVAANFSFQRGNLTDAATMRIKVLSNYIKSSITAHQGEIPCVSEAIPLCMVMERFENDKKHSTCQYRMVIPNREGNLELISVEKNDVNRESILCAFRAALIDLSCFSVN
jgi:3-dehydroquinate synthase